MRRLVLLLLVSLSGPAAAAPVAQSPRGEAVIRPTAAELERAYERHDPVELERLGARVGAARLCVLVEKGAPASQRAALAALELVDGSLTLLPRLVALADREGTDALAPSVLGTVRRIAERVSRGEVEVEELPADQPRAVVDALARLAAREERAPALRIEALLALAALATIEPSAQAKLTTLTGARDPEVRRAAAESLSPAAASTLVRLLAEDGVAAVAAAAGGSLCRDVPPTGTERKSTRAALQRLADMPLAARIRVRTLVVDPTLPESDRLDLIPCLRPGAQRAEEKNDDLGVLRAIGRGADGSLKRRARAYGGT